MTDTKQNSMQTRQGKRKILIVEDDSDINAMLCLLFTQEGYLVLSACNGKEALDVLRTEEKPDVILLDLWMPLLDAAGFRAVQEMDPKIADTPVIVMSADDSIDIKSLKLGLNRHVKKPLDIDILLQCVERAVSNPL